MKSAEGAFDAASDRFDAAERALDAAREERAQARRDRYAARQAHSVGFREGSRAAAVLGVVSFIGVLPVMAAAGGCCVGLVASVPPGAG
jgi:hypothetical protein